MKRTSQLVEALGLIGSVHNCNMLSDPEITDHYDCLSDVRRAIDLLNDVLEANS